MLMALCEDHTQLSSGTFGTCGLRGNWIKNVLCNPYHHRVLLNRRQVYLLNTLSPRQRSKLRPFWSLWRVEKYLATKILAKVANWRPTDLKRNLLEKLSKIGQI